MHLLLTPVPAERVMSVNADRNHDRSGKGLALEGLANSKVVP